MAVVLDADSVRSAVAVLDGWEGGPEAIVRTVGLRSFPAAIAVVDRVAEVAEEMDHHPDIDIRWRTASTGSSPTPRRRRLTAARGQAA